MKIGDAKLNTYIDFDTNKSKEDLKLKVGNNIRIPKYKNIFAKSYVPNWFEEFFCD